MLFFLVWFGQTGFGLGWPKEDHAKEVCWHHKAWQCLSTENKSEVGWSLTVRNSWNRDFYCKRISSVGHRKRKVWTGSWEWHCHLTASRTWRQVRSDIIRTQGEINTPHCGWPQPQPAVGRTAGKHCWMVPSFWEGTQMAANQTRVNMDWESGGFLAGKGCFGSSLPAVNDPGELKMNSANLMRRRRCFVHLWWQTLGCVRWDFPSYSPFFYSASKQRFQPAVLFYNPR